MKNSKWFVLMFLMSGICIFAEERWKEYFLSCIPFVSLSKVNELVSTEVINEIGNNMQEVHKIQLFMYQNCPYCAVVEQFLKKHNLLDSVDFLDAGLNKNKELLKNISSKTQAPYLVDLDASVKMPESLDIIKYFIKKFDVNVS